MHPLLFSGEKGILFALWDPINYKKAQKYGIGVDFFKKEELIFFWTKLIKIIIFTFIIEINFLLSLSNMFEHIYFFLPQKLLGRKLF